MKNTICSLLMLILAFAHVNAQVAIGTSTPDASAKFQIDATDKGFLAPRVALTSLTDNTTIVSPATGLMVYCNGTGGLEEGFYYWNGSSWTKMSQVSNNQDLGYVVGWPSNATPPGYLLPLSGGTYNWADYPEFQTFNGTYASQFIASSTATTFTLKDINSTGRFLRGGSTAGTDQAGSTKLPVIPFAISTAGAHTHSVDPAAVNTSTTGAHVHSVDPPSTGSSTDGAHAHTLHRRANDDNGAYDPGNGRWNEGSAATTDRGIWYNAVPTSSAGAHAHTTDIAPFNSASNGDHAHSVDVAATTSTSNGDHSHTLSGGDSETRPINTSIVWCIKVKPTASAGNITINNVSGTASGTNGLIANASNVRLGGALIETTTIDKAGYDLNFTGSGNVEILGNVAVGTLTPVASAKFQIDASDKGFLAPRVALLSVFDNTTVASPVAGLMVYCNGAGGLAEGYYFWNGTQWATIATVAGSGNTYGDVKTGIQAADHGGWVKLDGRAKSTLTAAQQSRATTLGIGANIPNASNSVLMQNGTTLGSVSGTNAKTIAQNQLPNVTLNGRIAGSDAGVVNITSSVLTMKEANNNWCNNAADRYTGYGIVQVPLNGGVTQQTLDVTPQSLSINTFIYLGN